MVWIMDIRQAFSGLLGSPQLLALRDGGPIVAVNNGGMVIDLRNGRPRRYVGKLSDYVATDWQVITAAQLQQAAAKIAAAGGGG